MNKMLSRLLWVLVLGGFAVGSVGLYQRFSLGHQGANYGSYVPWGLWVAAYIYFIGLSAGAFLLSTLVYVFQVKLLEPIGKLALFTALVTLIAAMLSIWLDLGHPERAWRLLLRTNFGSVMGWMIWFYTAYFLLLMAELWLALRKDLVDCASAPGLKGTVCGLLTFGQRDTSPQAVQRDRSLLRILGTLGVPLAIAFHGGVGALFGSVAARPYWHGGLTPIVFLVGALASGGALLAFVTALWGPNRKSEEHRQRMILMGELVLGLLLFDLLLEWAEYSIGLYSAPPAERAALNMILFGTYWWAFWVIHLALGAVVPLLLLSFRRQSPAAIALAGALIASSFLAVRLNIVLPGQAVEELEGLQAAFSGPGLRYEYFPSSMEWLFLVWTISLAGLLFLVGYQLLPIVRPTEVA